MATIPSYLSWTPKTGTGDASISIDSATPYKGRTNRSTTVTGKITGKENSVTVTVVETAVAEYLTVDSAEVSVSKDGETIHITGKSNTDTITAAWTENFGLADVTTFSVNSSITATSGEAIEGDPGAKGEFTFDITVVVPKNKTILARTAKLNLKGTGEEVSADVTITQALGDSYLYLNTEETTKVTVTIPAGGGVQTLKVLSNDTWTFEPEE